MSVSDEAVEAAAEELANLNSDLGDQLTDHEWARRVLEAAGPLIAAQALEDAAAGLGIDGDLNGRTVRMWLRSRAAVLRGQG